MIPCLYFFHHFYVLLLFCYNLHTARGRIRRIRKASHWIISKEVKRKTRWTGFINNCNHNQWSSSKQMCDYTENARWALAGCWKKGIPTRHLRSYLALAGLAQKWIEACEVLPICIRSEMRFGLRQSLPLRTCRVARNRWGVTKYARFEFNNI